jgi:N-acetylmuramate 1-kinase
VALLDNTLAHPRVFVHRDYHSRNLMCADPAPGVLDFQDAVYGPITYDLVSLLKDAYVAWPEERVLDWAIRYWEEARRAALPVAADFGAFYRDFEWMGVQRHLKVVGIFARLCHRDGKARYLADIPRVLTYLERAARRYREFAPLAALLDELHGRSHEVAHTF